MLIPSGEKSQPGWNKASGHIVFGVKMYFTCKARWVKYGHRNPDHRWALPVLNYPRDLVISHYPSIEVIFMIILHVFIIKKNPNLFSNYYPKYTIWVVYPFILNLGEFLYKFTFPEHYPIVREEKAMFSSFSIMFLIDTIISYRNYMEIISIKCT